ncbi:MAG: VTT domain-containing protein [Dehalococcoidia bacterium]
MAVVALAQRHGPASGALHQQVRLLGGAMLLMLLAVTAAYAVGGPEVMMRLGYPGVFLSVMLSSAAMVVPVPMAATAVGFGVFLESPLGIPPFLIVGLAAGTGSAIGELTGYMAGRAGHSRLTDSRAGDFITRKMTRWGPAAVFTFAVVPNPFLDIVGIAAGCGGMSVRTFLFSIWPGKLINYTATALLFILGADWLRAIF